MSLLIDLVKDMNIEEQQLLHGLKAAVTIRSANDTFVHHKWFIKYHLEIVENIATELCDMYPHANRFKVLTLAWLHDYEKIIDFDNQYNTELEATKELMRQIGFEPDFIREMATDLNTY